MTSKKEIVYRDYGSGLLVFYTAARITPGCFHHPMNWSTDLALAREYTPDAFRVLLFNKEQAYFEDAQDQYSCRIATRNNVVDHYKTRMQSIIYGAKDL